MERQDNDWIVEIKDMSFSYAEGSRVILDDVSLSFRKGEVIAIMGGSGMGKTTPVSYTHLTLPTNSLV